MGRTKRSETTSFQVPFLIGGLDGTEKIERTADDVRFVPWKVSIHYAHPSGRTNYVRYPRCARFAP